MADPRVNIRITADNSDALKKFKTTFTELRSGIELIELAAQKLQQAFEFAQAGAELERTRDKFDKLSVSIGTTADSLLTKMGDASGGLMSNAEMIQAATDIISLGLADNETDVIRLATVVSELGWDMQQVILTFANNSKLRLDALGLSIADVDEKTRKFEAQGFDADKAFDLAVLEAAEEKIGLVGSAAETSAGQFKLAEANAKNFIDQLKIAASQALLPTIEGFNTYVDTQNTLNEALELGVITQEDYNAAMMQLKFSTDDYQASVDIAQQKIDEYNEKQDIMNFGTELANLHMMALEESTRSTADEITDAAEEIADAAEDVYTFSDALDDAAKGRPSAVAGLIEDIKWLQAGGADIGQLMDDIEKALDDGIDPTAVGDSLATALVASLLASMQAGQTDFEGASQTLQDTLGIDAAEAEAMLSEFESAADAVAEAERQLEYQIVLDQQSQEILNSLTAVLGVDSHTVNISLVGQTRGGSQSFSGTSTGWDPQGPGGASGMNFIVPPGFPNDSFPMRVQSGEHVQVTPANQVGLGGGNAPVIVLLDGEQIAARVLSSAGSQFRQTRANGGGYVGR